MTQKTPSDDKYDRRVENLNYLIDNEDSENAEQAVEDLDLGKKSMKKTRANEGFVVQQEPSETEEEQDD